jgi:hypothetical protein
MANVNLIVLFFLINLSSLISQNISLDTISLDLTKNAYAVVRQHSTIFEVIDQSEAVTTINGTITVLSEKGNHHANLVIPYDKFTKIKNIEADIFDQNGKKLKSLKKKDIENYGQGSQSTSVNDNFVKYADLSQSTYPYTIKFNIEYASKNMLFYPRWEAVLDNSPHTSVISSTFKVIMPPNLSLRFKEQNMPSSVVNSLANNKNEYSWNVQNIKAYEREDYSLTLSELLPMVYTAPSKFTIENYSGNMNTWNDFGVFYGQLNKDREIISDELSEKVKDMTKNEISQTDKIKKIYKYLQDNSRYVSIQLGIGGWQSIPSKETEKNGYGDCKALSTLTVGMLKAIGIKSYYTLVKAGDKVNDIDADFPSSQFNHVFVCVPNQQDTIWLECTSQNNPFGYLGSFTSNRHVFLVTEDGGHIVKTPTYQPQENIQLRNVIYTLDETNGAFVDITSRYSGLQHELPSYIIENYTQDKQKEWLLNKIDLSGVDIKSFNFQTTKEILPTIEEKITLTARNVYTKSGSRIFITPNLLTTCAYMKKALSQRLSPFELKDNFSYVDSVSLIIPSGYKAENIPTEINYTSPFGTYNAVFNVTDNKILYVRRQSVYQGRHQAEMYQQYTDFNKKLVKADKSQIVLVKI